MGAVVGPELVFGVPDERHAVAGHRLFPLPDGLVLADLLDDVLDRDAAELAVLPGEIKTDRLVLLVLGDVVGHVALGADRRTHLLAGQLGRVDPHGLEGLDQRKPSRDLEALVLVVVAVDAGDPQLAVLLGNHAQDFLEGLPVVIGPHLLLQPDRIRALAAQADAAGADARGVDLDLVAHHECVAARLVVLHPEPPPVEQQRHVRIHGKLVHADRPAVHADFVPAAPGGDGLRRLLPELVLFREGLAPDRRVDFAVRDVDGPDHLRLGRFTCNKNECQGHAQADCQDVFCAVGHLPLLKNVFRCNRSAGFSSSCGRRPGGAGETGGSPSNCDPG